MGASTLESIKWQEEWGNSFRGATGLLQAGFITEAEFPAYRELLKKYSFVLPRYYAELIDRTDPFCPIRKQAIPSLEELKHDQHWVPDPLADLEHRPVPHITHRYRDRVLLHLTPVCSMYCRYCFRKSLLNDLKEEFFDGGFLGALHYIQGHPEIHEVILSGGDPLMGSDPLLGTWMQELSAITHIRRLRIHTRVPVTFPMRVTRGLVQALGMSKVPVIVVTHFNHPREVTPIAVRHCSYLRRVVPWVLNQSVLLRGVNDEPQLLAELGEKLFDARILPYYLHHPDPAQGTLHFNMGEDEGIRIYRELCGQMSGYLVPRYVKDDPDFSFKRPV